MTGQAPPQTTFPVHCVSCLACRPGQPWLCFTTLRQLFFQALPVARFNASPTSPTSNGHSRHSTPCRKLPILSAVLYPYPYFFLLAVFEFLVLHCSTLRYCTIPSHAGLYSIVTRLQLHVHVTLGLALFPPQQPASRNASPHLAHLTSAFRALHCTVRCGICDLLADASRCMTPQGSPAHHATACAPERRALCCFHDTQDELHHDPCGSYFILQPRPPRPSSISN